MKRNLRRFFWAACLLLPVIAGADVVLRSGRFANLADLSIRVKTLADAEDRPIPTLSSHEYKNVQFFIPFEWWMYQALSGAWSNRYGALLVAEMNRSAPNRQAKPVPEAGCKILAPVPEKWTPALENEWVEAFSNCKVLQREVEPKKKVDRVITRFDVKAAEGERAVGFLVVSSRDVSRRIFLFFRMAAGLNYEKSLRNARQIAMTMEFRPFAAGKKENVSAKPVPGRRTLDPERQKIVDSIRNYPQWTARQTKHFVILTNIKQSSALRDFERSLEENRFGYEAFFPEGEKADEVNIVRLFAERDDYLHYVTGMPMNTIGVWMPAKKELAVSPLVGQTMKEQREQMKEVISHEGFHQFLHYAVGEVPTAMWFNEGHAQFFEMMDVHRKHPRIELKEKWIKEVRDAIRAERPDLQALIQMSREKFYSGNVARNYLLALAMDYYQRKGAIPHDRPGYAQIPVRYYETIKKTHDETKAGNAAWKGIDMQKFTNDFIIFWQNDRLLEKADAFDPIQEQEEKGIK